MSKELQIDEVETEVIDGKINSHVIDSSEQEESELPTEDIIASGWKASEAFLRVDRNGTSAASPNIEITESTIHLYHAKQGNSRIVHTKLQGSGGTYIFSSPGRKTVSPGNYDHYINGRIVNFGWIGSGIKYK